MKKLLTVALGVVVLAAFADLGAAQQKGEERKAKVRGAFEETRQPAPGERGVKLDKPVLQMTGKVTQVNPTANTFTVMAKGEEVTFSAKQKLNALTQGNVPLTAKGKEVTVSAAKLPALPKVGEIVDITYTQTPGGPMEATTINTTKSNTF